MVTKRIVLFSLYNFVRVTKNAWYFDGEHGALYYAMVKRGCSITPRCVYLYL